MESWFSVPIKIFIVGLLLAIIGTFTWRSIEIYYTSIAATNAAHSAVSNINSYSTAAQEAANQTLPSTSVQSVKQVGNNLTQAVVSYTPSNTFSKVFSFLGSASPDQTISMTGTAPGVIRCFDIKCTQNNGCRN
jgi:uncharacterized protein (UPF0333 family)